LHGGVGDVEEEVVVVDEQDARDEMTQRVGIRNSGPAALSPNLVASCTCTLSFV
jgi:hypothetical protein